MAKMSDSSALFTPPCNEDNELDEDKLTTESYITRNKTISLPVKKFS